MDTASEKRLNGWQRIGVVLSVGWALYGAYWGNDYGLRQGDWVDIPYKSCIDDSQRLAADSHYSRQAVQKELEDGAVCAQSRDRDWRESIKDHFLYAALCGLVPIPLGWGIVYGVLALLRWIHRGFAT